METVDSLPFADLDDVGSDRNPDARAWKQAVEDVAELDDVEFRRKIRREGMKISCIAFAFDELSLDEKIRGLSPGA
ncbi:hypothetical protein [Streptomyces sp. NPDC001809]